MAFLLRSASPAKKAADRRGRGIPEGTAPAGRRVGPGRHGPGPEARRHLPAPPQAVRPPVPVRPRGRAGAKPDPHDPFPEYERCEPRPGVFFPDAAFSDAFPTCNGYARGGGGGDPDRWPGEGESEGDPFGALPAETGAGRLYARVSAGETASRSARVSHLPGRRGREDREHPSPVLFRTRGISRGHPHSPGGRKARPRAGVGRPRPGGASPRAAHPEGRTRAAAPHHDPARAGDLPPEESASRRMPASGRMPGGVAGNRETRAGLVHRLANILAFERRCIRPSFVALLHHTQRYASVARLAAAAHRRSRCVKLFTRRYTRSPPRAPR